LYNEHININRPRLAAISDNHDQDDDACTTVAVHAFQRYIAWRVQKGTRLGDIKQPVLLHDWAALMEFWPELAR